MIYYDKSEIANNRTWKQLFDNLKAEPFHRLEAHTGADLVIVPEPIRKGKASLLDAVKRGVLIQRKEGADLLQSIPKLADIEYRMLQCESIPVLATIGRYEHAGPESTRVNGHEFGWAYRSIKQAQFTWQLRGGLTMDFIFPAEAADWYGTVDLYVQQGKIHREDMVTHVTQKFAGSLMDEKPWRTVLQAMNGLGSKRGSDVANQFGSLAEAIQWLSYPDADDIKIPGIAQGTHDKIRWQMGLSEGQWMAIQSLAPTLNGGQNGQRDTAKTVENLGGGQ